MSINALRVVASLALAVVLPAQAALVTFDDLPAPPALNGATGFFFANGGSSVYAGVTWDSRFDVVGDQYRVDTGTPGPLFGRPHSGHFFVTNQGAGAGNDGLLLTTTQVLTGAWFGRNEYYGFGAGADQVTVSALHGSTVLGAVTLDLPELQPGQPEALGFLDASAFAALSGITGYRIDRRELGTQSGNWVADDFSFTAPSPVPEPAGGALLLAGGAVVALAAARRRHARRG